MADWSGLGDLGNSFISAYAAGRKLSDDREGGDLLAAYIGSAGQGGQPQTLAGLGQPAAAATGGQPVDARADVATLKAALAPMESGGRYDIKGPTHSRMGVPLGKYQIMSANLPQWSQEAVGRVVSPDEFLKSPELQERIAGAQMGKILDKYGNLQDAASVWHSGRPLAQATKAGARDVNMSTADYVAKTVGRRRYAEADMPDAGARPVEFAPGDQPNVGFLIPPGPQGADPARPGAPTLEMLGQLTQGGYGAREMPPQPPSRGIRITEPQPSAGPRVRFPMGTGEFGDEGARLFAPEALGPLAQLQPPAAAPANAPIPPPRPDFASMPAREAIPVNQPQGVPLPPRRPAMTPDAAPAPAAAQRAPVMSAGADGNREDAGARDFVTGYGPAQLPGPPLMVSNPAGGAPQAAPQARPAPTLAAPPVVAPAAPASGSPVMSDEQIDATYGAGTPAAAAVKRIAAEERSRNGAQAAPGAVAAPQAAQAAPQPIPAAGGASAPSGGRVDVATLQALARNPSTRSAAMALWQSQLQGKDIKHVDIGNAIVFLDGQGNEVRRIEKDQTPESVREFVYARKNGMTEAKTPAEYAREKEAPKSWERFETKDGRQVAWNPRDPSQTRVLDQGSGGWRPATPEEKKAFGISDGTGVAVSPAGEPKIVGKEASEKAPTEGQANANLYARRMEEADAILTQPAIASASVGLKDRMASRIPGVGNYAVSPEYQQADQAQRDFINATLRRESGAAIGESEFENARKQYFPQPGDSPQVLSQKARNRRTAIEGIRAAAGPAYNRPVPQQAPSIPIEPRTEAAPAAREPAPRPGNAVNPAVPEGATATNPQTGQKLQFRGGQWLPMGPQA